MPPRPGFPVSLLLAGRRAVVVGDSPKADERTSRLRAAGADVLQVGMSAYKPSMCAGAFVVLAHTDDPQRDRQVVRDARAAGCLVYAHDQPAVSDWAMPAVVRRGPVTVAIATDGVAPGLAGRLRRELGRVIDAAGAALDRLVDQLARARADREDGARARRLSALAGRLRLDGRLIVEPDSDDGPADDDPADDGA
jgi:precorrin-2 dehydrogenase/sirohydrochlorin ferrochelatase